MLEHLATPKMFDNWSAPPDQSQPIGLRQMKLSAKKDFFLRVKICRKQAKESRLFLRLSDTGLSKENVKRRDALAAEARELTLIFSAIISNSGGS
jgi:hypothetical protein